MLGSPRCFRAGFLLLALSFSTPLSCQLYSVQTYPVGHQPQGLAVSADFRSPHEGFVAVANVGDNTVSVLSVGNNASLIPVITQSVSSPYNVVTCSDGSFLVTSSGSTVTWLAFNGGVQSTVNVGPGAYAADCHDTSPSQAIISTLGDNALSMVNLSTGTVALRVPNVPGTRSANGIFVYGSATSKPWLAFVAGTQANVVTVVNLALGTVVAAIPVQQPVAVFGTVVAYVVSASGNALFIDPGTLAVSNLGIVSPANPVSAVAEGFDTFAVSGGSIVDTAAATPPPGQASFTVPGLSGAVGIVYDGSTCLTLPCSIYFATLAGLDSVASITVLTGPSTGGVGVTNAAAFDAWGPAGARPLPNTAAPGALATVFTPSQSGIAQQWSTALPLPPSLGGVSVRVGGTATYANSVWTYSGTGSVLAPLLYVSATQINFQMPLGIQGELVPVQISYPNGTTLLTSVRAGSTDPGIFTLTSVPNGPGAVLNQDNSVNLGSNPAARGSVIQIFATGAGATTPTLAAGAAAPASGSLVLTVAQPTVTIGGVNAPVQFSGMAPGFVGLWQINAVVPQSVTPGSTVSLTVSAGGVTSNSVTIAVQ